MKFIDGKNLGIAKNRLKVEAIFSNKKPLSFTTRLELYDDTGRTYMIPISGTTDNCLFTSYPYLQRSRGLYEISMEDDKKPIKIEEEPDDFNDSKDNLSEKTIGTRQRS